MSSYKRDLKTLNKIVEELKLDDKPEGYRGVNKDRVRVSNIKSSFNYRALCNCEAAYKIFYHSSGGNAYNTFVSKQFIQAISGR